MRRARFNGAAALGAAETASRQAAHEPAHQSFNGAAALGATETIITTVDPAQEALNASMGPQPWELRKQRVLVWQQTTASQLQWGRSLGSCGNSGVTIAQPDYQSGFNGAAALGAAETTQNLADLEAYVSASMGPQPWELRKRPSRFILQK